MATIEQVIADPAVKAGRVWAVLPLGGGRIVLTDNGVLIEATEADRGDGTFGAEVWPLKVVANF